MASQLRGRPDTFWLRLYDIGVALKVSGSLDSIFPVIIVVRMKWHEGNERVVDGLSSESLMGIWLSCKMNCAPCAQKLHARESGINTQSSVSGALGCRGAVTAVALTNDDSAVYSVGKEGSIVRLDVETGTRCGFRQQNRSTSALFTPSFPSAPQNMNARRGVPLPASSGKQM